MDAFELLTIVTMALHALTIIAIAYLLDANATLKYRIELVTKVHEMKFQNCVFKEAAEK